MRFRIRPSIGLLSLASVVLAGGLFYELRESATTFDIPITRAKLGPEPNIDIAAFNPAAKDHYAEISARPLFISSRMPAETSAVEMGSTTQPPSITLIGVILSRKARIAIVRSGSAPLATSVSVGSVIEGWQVSQIKPNRLVLRRNSVEQEIPFPKSSQRSAGSIQSAIQGRTFSANGGVGR